MRLLNAYDSRNLEQFAQILNEVHPDSEKVANATALQVICRQHKPGDEAYVKLLLEKGANPNHSPWGENHHDRIIATTLGAYSGLGGRKETLIKILKMLLDYGAEVNYLVLKRNYKKLPANVNELLPNSLLHDAMNRALDLREPEIIALLVKKGIQDHDNNFSSSPHLTVLQDLKGRIKKYNSYDRARYQKTAEDICLLLEKGYPAYVEKQQKLAAIKEAEERQRLAELQRQQEEKLRIQAEEKRKLDEAQRQLEQLRLQAAQPKESVQQVEKVLEIQEHDYNTQQLYHLHYNEDLEGFRALLESGYDPNMEVSGWGSILTQVCGSRRTAQHEYVDLLLKHGANPDAVSKNNQYCPLKMTLINGGSNPEAFQSCLKTVKLLLEAGANPNYPPAVNNHPGWGRVYRPLADALNMSFSIGQGNTELVTLLLSYGSEDLENKNGHTALEQLKNRRPPYFQGHRRYPNFDEFVTILELGHDGYQKLQQQREQQRLEELQRQAELSRIAEEERLAALHDEVVTGTGEVPFLYGGAGNDELAQVFDLHQPSSVTLEEVKQREEQRLTKIQESQHHLFSADSYKQCMKNAKMQAAVDAAVTTLTCIPSAIIETGGKLSECDRRGARTDRALYGLRRKECEHNESERQEKILKQNRDSHLEKFFKNFLRICELLGFAADGVLTSEQYNLVIEKMEEERAEKIKMLEALDLSGRRVEGYGSIGSHVKMSVMLSNFFDLDNDSFKSKIIETVTNIKAEKIKRKIENELRKKFGSICINCGRSSAFCGGCGYRKSSSKNDSSLSTSGVGNSTRRCNDNSYTKSSVSSDSRRGRGGAIGGAITTAYNNSRQRSSSAPPSTRSNGTPCRPSSDFNFSVCPM